MLSETSYLRLRFQSFLTVNAVTHVDGSHNSVVPKQLRNSLYGLKQLFSDIIQNSVTHSWKTKGVWWPV